MTKHILQSRFLDIQREIFDENWVIASHMIDALIVDIGQSKLILLFPELIRKSMMILHMIYKDLSIKNFQRTHVTLQQFLLDMKKFDVYEEK